MRKPAYAKTGALIGCAEAAQLMGASVFFRYTYSIIPPHYWNTPVQYTAIFHRWASLKKNVTIQFFYPHALNLQYFYLHLSFKCVF